MGFIFQQAYFLSNLNIQDNILLPALKAAPKEKDAAIARVGALMERFGIAHVKQHGITKVSAWIHRLLSGAADGGSKRNAS